jgi:outer membrane protein TolC
MKSVVVALLLSAAATPALATEVTLQDALRAAVADRPGVQAARAEAGAAAAAIGEARSGWLPHVTVSEQYTRTDEPAGSLFIALNQERNVMVDPAYNLIDPAAQDDYETRLRLTQTLYDPAVDFGLRRAHTASAAAAAGAAWSAEEAAFAALQAYLDVQQAAAALAWVETSRKEAAEIARLAGERRQAGIGLKADELRANVQLTEAQRRELAARNDLTLARRRLALAIGRPGGEIDIAAPLDELSFPPDAATTVSERADLKALALQVDAAGLAISQHRAEWLPHLGLTASYAWHDEDRPFGSDAEAWAVGAGLNWELFDGLRRGAATARATAEQQATAARLDEARREREFRLGEARLRAVEARLQRESARQAVTAADESRRLMQQRFEAGLLDLADLLAAQSALDRARFDAVGAEGRHLLALGNIHFQAGRFLQAFLPGEEHRP